MEPKPEKVCAVVVTHNRLALLRECLSALEAQTRRPDRVLVVDNASTDGTGDAVRAEFPAAELVSLPDNRGSSGGFHAGLEAAQAGEEEWFWLMDDDTIARSDALAALLAALAVLADLPPAPALLASRVVWRDGRLHPMNTPGFERSDVARLVEGAARGLVPVRVTTFVSLLVRRAAVERHGLPPAHFFIWSDDLEFTARILRHEVGYVVPDSVVEHRTKEAHTAVSSSGERFYFHVRNTLFMVRGSAWNRVEKATLVYLLAATTLAYLHAAERRRSALGVVARGLRDGLGPLPGARARP
jgi:GT2 family glycosyltransferase